MKAMACCILLLLSVHCAGSYESASCRQGCEDMFESCFLGGYLRAAELQSSDTEKLTVYLGCASARYVCETSCGGVATSRE